MLTWNQIQKRFKNEWVALTQEERNEKGEVVKALVSHHNKDEKEFYSHLKKHLPHQSLSIRFVGKKSL